MISSVFVVVRIKVNAGGSSGGARCCEDEDSTWTLSFFLRRSLSVMAVCKSRCAARPISVEMERSYLLQRLISNLHKKLDN
jgi:hypothetical protein